MGVTKVKRTGPLRERYRNSFSTTAAASWDKPGMFQARRTPGRDTSPLPRTEYLAQVLATKLRMQPTLRMRKITRRIQNERTEQSESQAVLRSRFARQCAGRNAGRQDSLYRIREAARPSGKRHSNGRRSGSTSAR